MNLFRTAIQSVWKKEHSDVKLNFVSWDCYSEDPPQSLDVFVFDAVFFHDFVDSLLPLSKDEIENYYDLIPYAVNACISDDVIYAVPQLICANLLYTRKGDIHFEIIYDLYHASERVFFYIPNEITMLCWYLEAVIDSEGKYTDTFQSLTENNSVLESLHMIRAMSDKQIINGEELFKNGEGYAFIGYTEAMYKLGTNFDFNLFSLSSGDNIPVFYADLAGVNKYISEEKRLPAIELLNVITCKDVLIKAAGSQYLLAARSSVYDFLSQSEPVYAKLKSIAETPYIHIFMIRPSGRALFRNAKSIIEKAK